LWRESLRELLSKTAGLIPALKSELARFRDKIEWAAVFGSVARSEERPESDIDLLLVGDAATPDLLPTLRRIEQRFGREVNLLRSEKEFRHKMRARDHFLTAVIKGPVITVIGSSNELEKTARRK
jgi:predicted nucleotidyltransferase